ncbi:MAG TPA: hypothetical protein VF060_00660 [Trebonia sp.]
MSLQRDQASVARGQKAQWNVSVWATSGSVTNVTLKLTTSPSSQKPVFSFGCNKNGTNSCTVGTVDSTSQPAQLQAQVAIAKTATSVNSVQLTVTGSGAGVSSDPKASVPISVTALKASASPSASSSTSSSSSAPGSASPGTTTTVPLPSAATSALPVGGLPFLNGSGSTLSPGGNASSLFPTLKPSSPGVPSAANQGGQPHSQPVADTLPAEASVTGAQYAGLGALAVAFILSVTRLSIRRRHAAKPGGGSR